MTGSGICYTWSGSDKRYEEGLLSISPDKVKFVDFDNHYAEPFISNIFTPSNHLPGVSLEEGTAMYVAILHNPDIDLNNYLSYTPPDGYELVSEDHKDDTGVKQYLVSKNFYCDPFTVYYGTAGKTFSDLGLSASKYFYYKKKDKPNNKINVRLTVSQDIIINRNTYHPYENRPVINTINLESGDGCVMNILVGLDSNHYGGSFDISFDGASPSNIKTYLLVNNQYYDVTNSASTESKRCNISKYKDRLHIVGWMYTTGGFDYTFDSSDWENNSLFTQEGTKDSFGGHIPDSRTTKFVVKFALSNDGYSRQDCQLTVDVTTNK